jgi:hypothetical protein
MSHLRIETMQDAREALEAWGRASRGKPTKGYPNQSTIRRLIKIIGEASQSSPPMPDDDFLLIDKTVASLKRIDDQAYRIAMLYYAEGLNVVQIQERHGIPKGKTVALREFVVGAVMGRLCAGID